MNDTTKPAQVWVMTKGEIGDGGNVLGVYTTKDAAFGDFMAAAQDMSFALEDVHGDENGAVHVHAGCDFLSLEPHDLRSASAPLPAADDIARRDDFEAFQRRVLDANPIPKFIDFPV